MSYYIYMVHCEDGSHYTGITTDPCRRMREHVLRLSPGAKYTKSHRVIALDALWSAQTRSEACRLAECDPDLVGGAADAPDDELLLFRLLHRLPPCVICWFLV